ncbi:hypothetical protein P3T39_000702 [Kitasatospora sp. GP82]|nr:hypothetical protein [Kitasatospora sp. GP82]
MSLRRRPEVGRIIVVASYLEFAFADGASVMLRALPATEKELEELQAPVPAPPTGVLPPGPAGGMPVGRHSGDGRVGAAKVLSPARPRVQRRLRTG